MRLRFPWQRGLSPELRLAQTQMVGEQSELPQATAQAGIDLRAGSESSSLFISTYYLDQYADVRAAGVDPLGHFHASGKGERRQPNPFLDLLWYEQHMMPLAPGYTFDNPFDHFVQVGQWTDLWPSAAFDPVYYRSKYQKLEDCYIALSLHHFLTIGVWKGYFCTHPKYEG